MPKTEPSALDRERAAATRARWNAEDVAALSEGADLHTVCTNCDEPVYRAAGLWFHSDTDELSCYGSDADWPESAFVAEVDKICRHCGQELDDASEVGEKRPVWVSGGALINCQGPTGRHAPIGSPVGRMS